MFAIVNDEECNLKVLDHLLGTFFQQYPLADLLGAVERFTSKLDITYKWRGCVWRAQLWTRREGYPETHHYLEVRLQAQVHVRIRPQIADWYLFGAACTRRMPLLKWELKKAALDHCALWCTSGVASRGVPENEEAKRVPMALNMLNVVVTTGTPADPSNKLHAVQIITGK